MYIWYLTTLEQYKKIGTIFKTKNDTTVFVLKELFFPPKRFLKYITSIVILYIKPPLLVELHLNLLKKSRSKAYTDFQSRYLEEQRFKRDRKAAPQQLVELF
jgi:hypothetical protein